MADDWGTVPGEAEGHRCEEPGCTSFDAFPCVHEPDEKNPSLFCSEHAFQHGYCSICGQFWAGIESFDFGPGYCENCKSEVEKDGYDPESECDEDYFLPEYEP